VSQVPVWAGKEERVVVLLRSTQINSDKPR